MYTKSMKFIPFLLFFLTIETTVLCQNNALSVTDSKVNLSLADTNGYLKNLKTEMEVQWPKNRTINIIFHGHSVPSGYFKTPTVNTLSSYPFLALKKIKELYPYAVVNVIITSIGGENAEKGASRFESDVLNHKPDIIFIDYGLNDRNIGLERAYKAWDQMIKKSIEKGIKVILLTPSPDTRENLTDSQNNLNKHSEQIRKLAAENHIGLADTYKAFSFLYSDKTELVKYMAQINHPNEKGHELIANEIMKWFLPVK
ncbi:MAG: GDSL-type esterase/lipase family protein [Paludibacter sp.]